MALAFKIYRCYLPIPNLPHDTVIARIFPQLQTASLLSLRQLCDAGCNATLNKDELAVYLRGNKILKGSRNFITKVWEVKFMSTDTKASVESYFVPSINNVYRLSTTSSVITYLHAAAFFPAKSTWLQAIKNDFFATWPFLTYVAVDKYLEPSKISSKAHIKQTRKTYDLL